MFNDECDYIVAVMLPHMCLEHETFVDQAHDFTVDEAHQLYVDELPLLMNHQDGEELNHRTGERSELTRVGTVKASSVRGNQGLVLAEIDPDLSDEATAASTLVATKIYGSVSLGNTVETRVRSSADGGGVVVVKTPDEVSLCRLGKRPGSTISAYCPGRSTVERLARFEPAELERMIDAHGYREAIARQRVVESDGERYISAVVGASRQRLADLVAEHHLEAKPYHRVTMSSSSSSSSKVKASADSAAATDEQIDAAMKQIDVDAPPSKEVPFVGTAEGEAGNAPPQRSSTSKMNQSSSSSPDATTLAETALKAQRELVEAKRAMAAQQESVREQLEELARIKAAEKAKQDEEYNAIVRSTIQYMLKAGEKQEDIESDVAELKSKYEANPAAGIAAAKRAQAIMIKASASVHADRDSQADELRRQADAKSAAYLAEKTAQLRELQQADAAISLQLASSTVASAAAAAAATPTSGDLKALVASEKTAFDQRWAEPTKSGVKREATTELVGADATKMRAIDDVPKFKAVSVKASADSPFDARSHFFEQWKAMGRPPTFREMAFGVQAVPTGRMKASITGQQVPEMRVQQTRTTPAFFDASTFAPEWDAKMCEALKHSRFTTSMAAAKNLAERAVETNGKFHYEVQEGRTEYVDGARDEPLEMHVV